MSKLRGLVVYNLELENGDNIEINVNYEITPGRPGVPYNNDGDPGSPPEPPEIEIEILNNQGDEVEVDNITNDIIIDLCFEDARGNEFDKYNDD